MKGLLVVVALAAAVAAKPALAYEYKLQFVPNGGARGLVVAGYGFSGNTVVGNCSYYTVHSGGSGRGGGYHSTTTYYNQTCTWDLYGNLLGIAQGAPMVPAPIGTSGTATIYAQNAQGGSTGSDPRLGGGFVNTIGAHFTWVTSNAYAVLPNQKPISVPVTLVSDGDVRWSASRPRQARSSPVPRSSRPPA